MKSILLPVEPNDGIASTLRTAWLLAERFGSHIEGMALAPTVSPFLAADTIGGAVLPAADDDQVAAAISEAQRIFDGFAERTATAHVTASWHSAGPHDDPFVGSYGRVFDVTVLGRPGSGDAAPRMSTLEAALFESGRPVLIAPPEPPSTLGERIAIGWNRSSETSRTIAFALPILAKAREVLVIAIEGGTTIGPDASELAAYLDRNGIPCSIRMVNKAEVKNVGAGILEQATRAGSDLIIKGAYTQSRLSQAIFGGATRHILAEATIPVFMAH